MLFTAHNRDDMFTTGRCYMGRRTHIRLYVTRDDGPTLTGESGICYLAIIGFSCTPAVRIRDARNVETAEELVYIIWAIIGFSCTPAVRIRDTRNVETAEEWGDTRCLVYLCTV